MSTVNLIIASYGGLTKKYINNIDKKYYLKYNIALLNTIQTNITQITIMKPNVNETDYLISDYYDFSKIDVSNIKDKIKIIECENIGISYGQFLNAIDNDKSFDYYIFIEDDYIITKDYFEEDLVNEYESKNNSLSFLCSFFYTNKKWNIMNYTINLQTETNETILNMKEKLDYWNFSEKECIVPDFSLGIFSKKEVGKIYESFGTIDKINNFFNINFRSIWIHQILFGYLLNICGIEIIDMKDSYLNIFYETFNGDIYLCNFDDSITDWRTKINNDQKFLLPIFIPTDIFYPNDIRYVNDIETMKKFVLEYDELSNIYNKFNKIKKNLQLKLYNK